MNKEQKIEEFLKTEIQIGESVHFTADKPSRHGKIVSIDNKNKTFCTKESSSCRAYEDIPLDRITYRDTIRTIGANPLKKDGIYISALSSMISSIVFRLDIEKREYRTGIVIESIVVEFTNWNPFIYKNGKKEYYQRDFVWTLEDNQNLIHSIYENIECGKIVIRERSWEELEKLQAAGETELFLMDIIDGKQRLHALDLFLHNKFPDRFGNYWKDLSTRAQRQFQELSVFSFCEIKNATDKQVIEQFLKLNFCGVPQSKEHIQYVQSLRD